MNSEQVSLHFRLLVIGVALASAPHSWHLVSTMDPLLMMWMLLMLDTDMA